MTMPRVLLLLVIFNTLVVVGGTIFNYATLKSMQTGQAVLGISIGSAGSEAEEAKSEYRFFPIEKVIVSLQGESREHYFVLDLVLQADLETDPKKLEQIDPMVRNSVVAHLSAMSFEKLRGMPIPELQSALERALFDDFASKKLAMPFANVLVSKLIVQ
ncbi:flagellar basal body-associated FliL family protein [Ectopseudomonas hydrolytica]|uniref:Flagellar protein FliL n=1 Tax=Ectopseudomonas hydrolytica TaxID=2493633 RepID=A0ABY5A853_9GAMM|nr:MULTISPECIES: flagellar basal body-associated FliL family protein [Pseudomonas]MDH0099319.1 flagellar basal body-associated FliL family protein [Pseudomonas sp. GD04158]USR40043.1 flagellar basal body-associated FliL family protein [Pseudomonas hydrolytica]